MFVATLPLVVMFAGILMYVLCTNPRLIWIGQVMICTGMGACLLGGAERIITAFG